MKITSILITFFWALFICHGTNATPFCSKSCTRELNPTCGTLRRSNGRVIQCTFGNPCLLRLRICQTRENWTALPGRCLRDSPQCRDITRSG